MRGLEIQYKQMKTKELRAFIYTLNRKQCEHMLTIEHRKELLYRLRGRLLDIGQKEKIEEFKAMIIKGHYIGVASKACGIGLKVAKEVFESLGIEYNPTISRERATKKRKDRLHYHKWNGNLKIKNEFFETIDEEWY